MPEPAGMTLATAIAAVRTLVEAIPVVGFGATAITLANGDGPKTTAAITEIASIAFGLG
jgi:hypothetical protein